MQIESDLHMEFRDKDIPLSKFLLKKKDSKYLCLCGDICPVKDDMYENVINYCSTTWELVFVILGNHEFYGSTYSNTIRRAREICSKYNNVHLLDRDVYYIDNIRIVGCTLWSQVHSGTQMNDYNNILNDGGGTVTYLDVLEWHRRDREWLEEVLATTASPDIVLVCLTHHLPSYNLLALRYRNCDSSGYATSLEHLLTKCQYWACGHTHVPCCKTINGCQVYINPRGYKGESGVYRPCIINI